jgi:uncharacterized Fe-S center protein
MINKKKRLVWIILLSLSILIICILLIVFIMDYNSNKSPAFSCNSYLDCVSQCSNGCVNSDWAISNPDTSECFRAWECSCVNKRCYTDGKPRI